VSSLEVEEATDGLKTMVLREFVPSQALETIQRDRATITFLVPAMLLAMLAERNVEKFHLSSLRQILYGASPIPLELLRKSLRVFKHTGFFQVYGLTETTGVITVLVAADHSAGDDEILRSCGRPIEGVELRIIDASALEPTSSTVKPALAPSFTWSVIQACKARLLMTKNTTSAASTPICRPNDAAATV
jgi:acyl-CoA synthetase (AMP-forming)/AMP-acid ligase II